MKNNFKQIILGGVVTSGVLLIYLIMTGVLAGNNSVSYTDYFASAGGICVKTRQHQQCENRCNIALAGDSDFRHCLYSRDSGYESKLDTKRNTGAGRNACGRTLDSVSAFILNGGCL